MFVIAGKTCSGKNTVAKELVRRGYKRIITYTTRPPRKGEENEKDYHFITDDGFKRLDSAGFFAETDSYNTVSGTWYYGSAKADYEKADDRTFVILTPRGVEQVKEAFKDSVRIQVVYLYANAETIALRQKARHDNAKEAERRRNADTEDFRGFENVADFIVYNNKNNTVTEVVDRMKTLLESRRK